VRRSAICRRPTAGTDVLSEAVAEQQNTTPLFSVHVCVRINLHRCRYPGHELLTQDRPDEVQHEAGCTVADFVLLVLSCNRSDCIQAATSSKQIDIRDCRASTSRGRQDPITWVSSAYRWPCRPCCSIRRTRSAVYSTNKMGPRTDPCGTPHERRTMEDLVSPRRTYCVRPHRYD